MDISVIIVSWKVREKLKENLYALFQSQGDFSFEVIVADNDSNDGTIEMIEKDFPQVKLLENKDNLGFGKGCNQGSQIAQGRYLLFLNPDMRTRPDTLINMLNWMDNNPQAIIAGCRLVNDNNDTVYHVRRFPTVWDQLAVILKLPHFFPMVLDKYIPRDFDYNQAAKVDSIRGSFFMVNKLELVEITKNRSELTIPNFDESYFIWFEEVDYCRQVYQAGGEVWYTPAAECVDHVAQSFSQIGRSTKQGYFRDSMQKYFGKWHAGWRFILISAAWVINDGIFRILGKLDTKK